MRVQQAVYRVISIGRLPAPRQGRVARSCARRIEHGGKEGGGGTGKGETTTDREEAVDPQVDPWFSAVERVRSTLVISPVVAVETLRRVLRNPVVYDKVDPQSVVSCAQWVLLRSVGHRRVPECEVRSYVVR